MPANLEEFKQRIASRDSDIYKRFDEYLCNKIKDAKTKRIEVAPLPDIPYQILNQVLEDWRKAGWVANYHSDQREGDWITIGF